MRRRLVPAAFLAAAVAAALLTTGASDGPAGERYTIVFDNAFGLTEGGDFKIQGVRAGTTTSFEVGSEQPRRAIVEVEIEEAGVADLRRDAECGIQPQSLIGEYFVNCDPGRSPERLPEGATIPVERTSSTIPIDLVNNIMRRPYRERFRLIVAELGAGLAGRPEDLAEVIRRAHPGLRETSKTLRVLARQRRVIQRLISDARVAVGELEDNKRDVARWVVETGETAEISASRRDDIARSFERFPGFLAELEPYMARLGELADAQVPLLQNARRAGPALEQFVTRLGPFSTAAAPAFRSLGAASEQGLRAVRSTEQEVAELRQLAADAPRFAKPLRQFLASLDDRKRAVENDPRAKATDPPAGDKTHIPDGSRGGFTGMEAFWNYTFWQTLAINGFDEVGHILRLQLIEDECGGYQVRREGNEELFDRCNQFLGPDQPGITTPDPTDDGTTAAGAATTRERPGRMRSVAEAIGLPAPPALDEGGPAPVAPDRPLEAPDALPALPDADQTEAFLDYLLAP